MYIKMNRWLFFFLLVNLLVSSIVSFAGNHGVQDYNLRTDETYIYMDLEDGVLPYFSNRRANHFLDSNSTIGGVYCLNITYETPFLSGVLAERYDYDNSIRPNDYSFKIIISSMNTGGANYIDHRLFSPSDVGPSVDGTRLRFQEDGSILFQGKDHSGTIVNYYFASLTPFDYNSIYTILYSDVDYVNGRCDVTVSNSTSSETKTDCHMLYYSISDAIPYSINSFNEFSINSFNPTPGAGNYVIFIDDWTVGNQVKLGYDVIRSSVFNDNFTFTNTILNDGSPLQNDSKKDHQVKLFYDTTSYPAVSYTYYFNEYNVGQAWDTLPGDMVDGDTGNGAICWWDDNDFIQLLTNHTGNVSTNPSGNIKDVEMRVWNYLSKTSLENGTNIKIRPVFNGTINGSIYPATADWIIEDFVFGQYTDWIKITDDALAPNWNWSNFKNVSCRVIADFNGVVAGVQVFIVQLRVTVNLSAAYNNNVEVVSSSLNTGDTFSATATGLNPGTMYYGRIRMNTSYTNSSSFSWSEEKQILTSPFDPTGVTVTIIDSTSINISWTAGTGSNKTMLRYKTTGVPTGPSDGTGEYFGSNNYKVITNIGSEDVRYYKLWGFTEWGNRTKWSDNGTDINWGALIINCYDENNNSVINNFSVFVSNANGSSVYTDPDCNNPHEINVTLAPKGAVSVLVNKSGYYDRIYQIDNLQASAWYILDAYLPPADLSYLYRLTVIGPIQEYNTDPPVEGATVNIKRYINASVGYSPIGIYTSDGDGNIFVYLIPGVLYKVTITADNYDTSITDYIPSDSVFTQNFRLIFSTLIPPTYDLFYDVISFTAVIDNPGCGQLANITISYTDTNSSTTNTFMILYEISPSGSLTVISTNSSTSNSWTYSFSGRNSSRRHRIVLYFNNTASFYGVTSPVSLYVERPCVYTDRGPLDLDDRIDSIIGDFKIDGQSVPWENIVALFLPIMLLVSFGPFNTGIGILSCGMSMIFVEAAYIFIGISGFSWVIAGIGVFILFLGIIYMMAKPGGVDHL